ACPEEIAWRMGFINETQLEKLSEEYPNSYGDYLKEIIKMGRDLKT
ncbi:MAG: hypothetical protein RJA81_1714, partial [Planctomycetota bacterium]